MGPNHITTAEWHHALGAARQACARVFRDGGSPADAMRLFGLPGGRSVNDRWDRAVDAIAEFLCAKPLRRAA